MTHEITANWDVLYEQSKENGRDYFWTALKTLKDSELEFEAADVVALAQVMASDFLASTLAVGLGKLGEDDV
jgi:hypothetical protein